MKGSELFSQYKLFFVMTQHVLVLINQVAKFRLRQVPVFIFVLKEKTFAVCQIRDVSTL